MISIKNRNEIMGFRVESNLNIVERTWNNTNWTTFRVKDNFEAAQMISIKNRTEIMGFKVESNLNIVEWTWNNSNWTTFHVKDNLLQR